MKTFKIVATVFAFGSVLSSCEREDISDSTPIQTDFTKSAIIEFYNASPNTSKNFVYIDGKAVNTATLAYNTSFPVATSNYGLLVDPGNKTILIRDTSSTSTIQPQLSFTQNLEAGKSYTVFTYDTVTAIKKLVVENKIEPLSDTTAGVRLAHFAFLKTGTPPAIDVFSVTKNANVFSNIGYGQVSDYISFTASSDTLIVRQAGSTSVNLDTLTSFNPTRRRYYTLIFGGRYMTNEAGGATLPRTLTSYINY